MSFEGFALAFLEVAAVAAVTPAALSGKEGLTLAL